MNLTDTIAAIATASGEAGISVVRVSGADAFDIADRVFQCQGRTPSERPGGTFAVGHVVEGNQLIDQALLLIMRAPHSYTCEDVVEIQGHGGSQSARRILRCVLDAGARLANPGEFTQRAFLNGRLDLVQAEAVLDLIHARSDRAAAAALDQLEGRLSQQFNALYDHLIAIASDIEATLDFPEDELPETVMPDILKRSHAALGWMRELIDSWDEGHLLRDGAWVVISGKPNVGKSTLLNGLLGRDRAIVTDTPGTTRDTIEEDLVIGGLPIRLVDTAGVRDTHCEIEKMGIQRTHSHVQRADLHIYIIDATQPIDEQEINSLSTTPKDRRLLLRNKIDLTDNAPEISGDIALLNVALTQTIYVEQVKNAIYKMLSRRIDLQARPHAAISERHRNLLVDAHIEMEAAVDMLSTTGDEVVALVSSRMRTVLDYLGTVTGRTYQEELLDNIFSRFCIGK